MDEKGYREFLAQRDLADEAVEEAVELVLRFDSFRQAERGGNPPAGTAQDDVDAFSCVLVSEGQNTWDAYFALARYGRFIDNHELYLAAVAYLDGHEAFGNLHKVLGERIGTDRRDALFSDADVPPIGTPSAEKARLMSAVVGRLEVLDVDTCIDVLGDGLRDLEDEWYEGEKQTFDECGNVDAYLSRKSKEFIGELEEHRAEGKWWWGQEVTDEMIEFVRLHPEISSGVREGHVVYKAKIPYMSKEHLEADDPTKKRYYYCHCPWARESIISAEFDVPPVFCNCSAAFSKKPWEVIFGRKLEAEVLESVLAGDKWCRFAIQLPDDAVLSA